MYNFGFNSKKKLAKEIARLYFEYDNTPCASVEIFHEDCASQSALNMLCKRLKIKPAHRSILGGGTGEYKKADFIKHGGRE